MKIFENLQSLLEKRMKEYKAWYDPFKDEMLQFPANGTHEAVAKDLLGMDNRTALKKGYYRVYVGHEISVESFRSPSPEQYTTFQNSLIMNSYEKFDSAMWEVVSKDEVHLFSAQSIFHMKDFNKAEVVSYN